jgi:hypothetical protein
VELGQDGRAVRESSKSKAAPSRYKPCQGVMHHVRGNALSHALPSPRAPSPIHLKPHGKLERVQQHDPHRQPAQLLLHPLQRPIPPSTRTMALRQAVSRPLASAVRSVASPSAVAVRTFAVSALRAKEVASESEHPNMRVFAQLNSTRGVKISGLLRIPTVCCTRCPRSSQSSHCEPGR